MKISLEQVGKKFQRHWIFRDIDFTFSRPHTYAILGANGSGKSTLMRILAGMQTPSTGKVIHEMNGKTLDAAGIFPHVSLCAPGMDIIDEMTLREFLSFHFSHKRLQPGLSIRDVITLTGLERYADNPIGDYSSGMKQRVKLAQALFSDTPLLLLDEPCTNLDETGVNQYLDWIKNYSSNRLVIVASNDEREYSFCEERILMSDWKKSL